MAVTWRVPARVLEQLELRWFDAELREGRPEHKTCRNPLSDTAFGGYRAVTSPRDYVTVTKLV